MLYKRCLPSPIYIELSFFQESVQWRCCPTIHLYLGIQIIRGIVLDTDEILYLCRVTRLLHDICGNSIVVHTNLIFKLITWKYGDLKTVIFISVIKWLHLLIVLRCVTY
jgi:hypothetical protein